MLGLAAQTLASAAPAIISAAAALSGVCVAQTIAWLQRRSDANQRRRDALAQTVTLTESLILDAHEQIKRAAQSGTPWHTQLDWQRLRSEGWPSVRGELLAHAALEADRSNSSFYTLALRMQDLLNDEENDAAVALAAWDAVQRQTLTARNAALVAASRRRQRRA